MFDVILHICITGEMAIINNYVCYKYSKKRYSPAKTVTSLILISLCFFGLFLPLLRLGKNYGNGNGLGVMVGLLYLISFKYIYDQPTKVSVGIACTIWTFTMALFAISIQASYWLFPDNLALSTLIIQTLLYATTVPLFLSFAGDKLVYLLNNIPQERQGKFIAMGIGWFFTMAFINFELVMDIPVMKPLIFLLLIFDAYMGYSFLLSVVESSGNIMKLEESLNNDDLTGIPNRYRLFPDVEELISAKIPFKLVFFDLNNFKQVNDSHGHLAGDEYLKAFSRQAMALAPGGQLYRMAGDEFVYINAKNDNLSDFFQALERLNGTRIISQQSFLGVSYGVVSYPKDATTITALLAKADKTMYTFKASRKSHPQK